MEILFPGLVGDQAEVVVAELSTLEFESFWESDEGLRAYIDSSVLDHAALDALAERYGLEYREEDATVSNWTPAQQDDPEPLWLAQGRLYVRGSEHPEAPEAEVSLVIDPKLSFGSGHHPTTALCVDWMMDEQWHGLQVCDVGTGSGILALLAERLGAAGVMAFDNNPWAIAVGQQNAALNGSQVVEFFTAEPVEHQPDGGYPLVLANLNAMAIRATMAAVARLVAEGGRLLLSGYTDADAEEMHGLAEAQGLRLMDTRREAEWWATVWAR